MFSAKASVAGASRLRNMLLMHPDTNGLMKSIKESRGLRAEKFKWILKIMLVKHSKKAFS